MASRFSLRAHETGIRDLSERFAFVMTFLVGAVGIIALKALSVNPYIVAGFAAGMIAAYVLFAMVVGRLQIEPELIGDNCYYLGFLFTLTSLSFTLSQLVGTEGDAVAREALIGRVISGFGVALSSTIVGVFLRVVLMQIRPDIVARDREMHIAMHESVRELKRQLSTAIVSVKQFTVESVQLAGERDRKVQAEVDSAFADLSARISRVADESFGVIQKMQEDIATKTAEAVSGRMDGATVASVARIEEAFKTLAASAEKIVERDTSAADAVAVRISALSDRIDQLGATFGAFGDRFNQIGESIDSGALGKATEEMRTALSASATDIRAASEQLTSATVASAESIDTAAKVLVAALAPRRRGFWFFGSAKE